MLERMLLLFVRSHECDVDELQIWPVDLPFFPMYKNSYYYRLLLHYINVYTLLSATLFDLIELKGVVLFQCLHTYRQFIDELIINISRCVFQRFYEY